MDKKILIVEDDSFLRGLIVNKLQEQNYQVNTASNGEDALESIESEKPNLILLDIILPTIDGFEVLEKIKNDSTKKDIPVIVFSNMGENNDIEKGKELGADEFLVKSNFTLDELVEKVQAVIS